MREIKKSKVDYDIKIRQKEELIKSKDKRLKLLRDNERKCKVKNDKLRAKIAMKEVEACSLVKMSEENEQLEGNDKNPSQNMKDLESKITDKSKEYKKLKTDAEVKIEEVKA